MLFLNGVSTKVICCSFFLFVICAEGLLALFDVWEQQKRICGVIICVGAPTIHHLLFANDSLYLLRAL